MDGVGPLVSFVVPVRNDVLRLQRCLNSIVRNEYPRALIEIIVVDNESTDGSARAAREYGAIVIRSAGDSLAAHRNRGARAALGSIIAFADSDHEIDRNWCATAVDVLSDPRVAATGAAYLTDPRPSWVQQHYDGMRARAPHRAEVPWIACGNLAVKRAAFERVGGFNESLTVCEDVDLCNRLSRAGFQIVADPDLRSIHFGDPKTLKALFMGELWRGRDNLRVTFDGPLTFHHLRRGVVPLAALMVLTAGLVALGFGYTGVALACVIAALAPAVMTAAGVIRRQLRRGLRSAMQALAVAVVFDLARGLAPIARGTHRARRAA